MTPASPSRLDWVMRLLATVGETSTALADAAEVGQEGSLDASIQSVLVAESLFLDLQPMLPGPEVSTVNGFAGTTGTSIDLITEALKGLRVAAYALGQRGQSTGKALAQAGEATEQLESALKMFIAGFREFLRHGGHRGIEQGAGPILERYEDQLEARQLVAEVRETRDEAKRVLTATRHAAGATGEASLARHFGIYAQKERKTADILRGSCIAVLMLITGVAAALLIDKDVEFTTAREIGKLAFTLPLAALAAYLAREASRHRKVSRQAQELEIRLQTVDAYTEPLPDVLRDQIRGELGKQIFASVYQDSHDGDEQGPSVATDAVGLLEQLLDVLKTASHARPSDT